MTPQPLGDPKPVTVEFQYKVSNDWIEEMIREQGMRMPDDWHAEFSLPDVPTHLRLRLYRAHSRYMQTPGYPTFFAPTDDPEIFLTVLEGWLDDVAEEEESGPSFDQARSSWIDEHGSERLRIAQRRSYKINRLYALERAAKEFPEFWVDTSEESIIRERTDPSMTALELEDEIRNWITEQEIDESLDPRIVWLVDPPKALEEHLDESGCIFEQQEAILINDYLVRYSLILPLDRDLRNSGSEPVDQ